MQNDQADGDKEIRAMVMVDGKVAIVTGAGHDVGRGEALELAAQEAKVVVNDLGGSSTGEGADKRPADEVAALIKDRGGEAVANYDDGADFNGAKNIVDQAIDAFGRLDVLVNNAGILRDKMIFSMTEDDFDSVIRVHMKGTFAPMHHASVYWREQSKAGNQPRASIINTASGAGLRGNIGQTNYGGAKAGIAAMTIIASLELARYGVRANVICPGGMTRLAGTIIKDMELKEPEEYTEFTAMNPANSAPMVVFLASDESITITGQCFRAVGNSISHYIPWTIGTEIISKDEAKWAPEDIGPAVYTEVFRSRHPGLRMGD
jgi:NAD(P)-dependent dehydrogenase (short-subunit alcohol dehydrogenase family)